MQLHRTLAAVVVVGLLVTAGCAGPSEDPSDATPTEQADVPAEGNGTAAPESTPTPATGETPTEGMATDTPTEGMATDTPTATPTG